MLLCCELRRCDHELLSILNCSRPPSHPVSRQCILVDIPWSMYLHSHSGLLPRILNLYWTKWALAFVCFSFFFFIFLSTCARLSWSLSFLFHVKLFFRIIIVSYLWMSRYDDRYPSAELCRWFALSTNFALSVDGAALLDDRWFAQ